MRFAIALAVAALVGFGVQVSAFADSHTAKPADEAPAEVSAPAEQPAEGEKAAAEGEEMPAEEKAEEKAEAQPE